MARSPMSSVRLRDARCRPATRSGLTTKHCKSDRRGMSNICHCHQTEQNALLNGERALQISSFSITAPLAAGLALSGCATNTTATQTPLTSSEAPPPSAGANIGQRDLTLEEKQVITDAVTPSLRNPGSAKYHWATFPAVVTADSVNYCATVDAQSPYAGITADKPTSSKHR